MKFYIARPIGLGVALGGLTAVETVLPGFWYGFGICAVIVGGFVTVGGLFCWIVVEKGNEMGKEKS